MRLGAQMGGDDMARDHIRLSMVLNQIGIDQDHTPRHPQRPLDAAAHHQEPRLTASGRQPPRQLRQGGLPTRTIADRARHPLQMPQQRLTDFNPLDHRHHAQRMVPRRTGQPKQHERRHRRKARQHADKPQPSRPWPLTLHDAAQLFDGRDHLVFILGQFQCLTGVAIGMINRGPMPRIGARNRRNRPMCLHPVAHIGDGQRRLAD